MAFTLAGSAQVMYAELAEVVIEGLATSRRLLDLSLTSSCLAAFDTPISLN